MWKECATAGFHCPSIVLKGTMLHKSSPQHFKRRVTQVEPPALLPQSVKTAALYVNMGPFQQQQQQHNIYKEGSKQTNKRGKGREKVETHVTVVTVGNQVANQVAYLIFKFSLHIRNF